MAKRSFIYRHIRIYRLIMNILYLGKYKRRFTPVIQQLNQLAPGTKVLELCFGDIYIAEFCRKAAFQWTGIDLNPHFVDQAKKLGYHALIQDLTGLQSFPKAQVCIMMGSLYHFHPNTEVILGKMFQAADIVIISEPVLNLSSKNGLLGFFAKNSANVGKGDKAFRYTRASFLFLLEKKKDLLNYRILSLQDEGKDLIVKLIKNGSH